MSSLSGIFRAKKPLQPRSTDEKLCPLPAFKLPILDIYKYLWLLLTNSEASNSIQEVALIFEKVADPLAKEGHTCMVMKCNLVFSG